MKQKITIKLILISSVIFATACGGGTTGTENNLPVTIKFDCTDGPDCPAINISGDPVYVLPNGKTSPMRGHADPSIRKDPNSDRLWMSYSYVGIHAEPSNDPAAPFITPYVSVHLAHSDDNGNNWLFDKNIWKSTAGIDQGFTAEDGYSIHEVSTITPFTFNNATEWFGLHLRYFLKKGDPIDKRLPASFHHRLTRATTPNDLGNNTEAVLSNPMTAPGWGSDINLSQLDPALNDCDLWAESALFQDGNKLYLITECLKIDTTTVPATRLYDQEFTAVFATDVSNDVTSFNWQWLGNIVDSATANELGSVILTQVDIARARDGSLLLLVTPSNDTSGETISHFGCRVLEIESLNPPKLATHTDGSLVIRAEITSSDSESSGLCAYDPASDTGIVLVRTHVDTVKPELFWQLHATGIHP